MTLRIIKLVLLVTLYRIHCFWRL